jgi:hypothetical protein
LLQLIDAKANFLTHEFTIEGKAISAENIFTGWPLQQDAR